MFSLVCRNALAYVSQVLFNSYGVLLMSMFRFVGFQTLAPHSLVKITYNMLIDFVLNHYNALECPASDLDILAFKFDGACGRGLDQ